MLFGFALSHKKIFIHCCTPSPTVICIFWPTPDKINPVTRTLIPIIRERFGEERFEVDCHRVGGCRPPQYTSEIQYDLQAAVMRQRDFFYNVSLPHYKDSTFIQQAIRRYKRFIEMKKVFK